jgi:hypothetical protein
MLAGHISDFARRAAGLLARKMTAYSLCRFGRSQRARAGALGRPAEKIKISPVN